MTLSDDELAELAEYLYWWLFLWPRLQRLLGLPVTATEITRIGDHYSGLFRTLNRDASAQDPG